MRIRSFSLLTVAAALALPGVLLAQDSQPSLADVAKQKSTTAKAKKVITDEDMPSTSTSNPDRANAPAAASAASPAASSAVTDDKKTGDTEAGKTGSTPTESKTATATGKLAELQKELDEVNQGEALLNKKLDQLQQKVDNASSEFRKKLYQESIDNQQTTLSEFRKRRAELEQQIADERSKSKT